MVRFSSAAWLAALPLCAVAAPPQYAVTDLGVQDTGEGLLWPAAGATSTCAPAPSNFPGLGGSSGSCIYASNSVAYVGVSSIPGGGAHAVRWIYANGVVTVTDLGLLPNAMANGTFPVSNAFSLNRVGGVVGQSATQYQSNAPFESGFAAHGFLWNNGTLTDLGAIAGSNYSSSAEGVNDSDEVVGWTNTISSANGQILTRAFVEESGTMYNLTFYLVGGPTVLLSDATAIDCQGNISAIGTPAAGGSTHTYLLVRQGTPRTNCPE